MPTQVPRRKAYLPRPERFTLFHAFHCLRLMLQSLQSNAAAYVEGSPLA